LVGRRSFCGRRLSIRSIDCTPALCDMNNPAAAVVCGLWRYTSVMCLPSHPVAGDLHLPCLTMAVCVLESGRLGDNCSVDDDCVSVVGHSVCDDVNMTCVCDVDAGYRWHDDSTCDIRKSISASHRLKWVISSWVLNDS